MNCATVSFSHANLSFKRFLSPDRNIMPTFPLRRLPMLTLLFGIACLASCGGGDNGAAADAPKAVSLPPASAVVVPPRSHTVLRAEVVASEAVAPGAITSVVLENTGTTAQAGGPLTFGQVFADGHLYPGEPLTARLADGTDVPLQVDVKARHANGSVRHAVLSLVAPALAPGQRRSIGLVKGIPVSPAALASTPAKLLDSGFGASVRLTLGQHVYTASVDAALRNGSYTTWLAGPVANEWLLALPLTDAQGVPHPHLTAHFAIRALGTALAKVDVTIENAWAFEPGPQNFTYDAEVLVGGASVYTKTALTHYHHARWRKVFWWGTAPQVHIRHNTAYLIASRALPNYDQSVVVAESQLAALKTRWSGARTEPMGSGLAVPYMPTTGGRPDIGLLPSWSASYLLSMDKRAKDVTLGTADQAGSWSAHFRDKRTGRPVTLFDYPYMTVLGQRTDTLNPATGKLEAFPACAGAGLCDTPLREDASHQPGFAYLPYLVTGDYYYLEELQFWAMWDTFMSNPGYRDYLKGLVKSEEVRGQAWSLRTLGEAAYITPDADPFKAQFQFFVNSNLDWYNANYTNNPGATSLGALTHGYAIVYNSGTGLAPWMDDFFTSAVGHVAELGFSAARPLLAWKAKFPILRMTGKGACWINGAIYTLKVRDSASAPLYTSIGKAWSASQPLSLLAAPCGSADMARALGLHVGEMTGYSSDESGYPSNMQPALAYAADVAGWSGASAWTFFANRSVKPNYGLGPQFAIVPRP
jgi:hypothetical protein